MNRMKEVAVLTIMLVIGLLVAFYSGWYFYIAVGLPISFAWVITVVFCPFIFCFGVYFVQGAIRDIIRAVRRPPTVIGGVDRSWS